MTDSDRSKLLRELEKIEKQLYELDVIDNSETNLELESLLEEQSYVRAYESSYNFLTHSWHTFEPNNFVQSKHLHAIGEHLDACLEGQIRNLIINIAPRNSKTSIVTRAFPAYCWIKKPGLKIANVSYSANLATDDCVASKQIITSEWYQKGLHTIWKDLNNWDYVWELSKTTNLKNDYYTTMNGRRFSTSTGGTFTGKGGDIIIIDDPLNANDAHSKVEREKCNNWSSQTLSTRLNDKEKGIRILVMQRLHECLLPDSLINIPTGVKPIKDLLVGDSVISSEGKDEVLYKSNKQYDGDIYGIRTYGHFDQLWVTSDHEILTERGWIKAKDLNINDILIYEINHNLDENLNYIKSLYPKLEDGKKYNKGTGNFNGNRNKVSITKTELEELLKSEKSILDISKKLKVHRSTVQNCMYLYGLQIQKKNYIPEEIFDNPLFWRFIGYWLAEGCVTKIKNKDSLIRLVFHKEEKEYIQDIEKTFSSYVNIKITPHKTDNSTVVSFTSVQLGNFLINNFGKYAKGKYLPEWVNKLPIEFKKELIKGYYRGDGCLSKNYVRFGSVSLNLLSTLRQLLYQLNVKSNLIFNPVKNKKSYIKNKIINSGESYELRCYLKDVQWLEEEIDEYKLKVDNSKEKNKLTKIKIKSIETKKYDGLVYDITTNAGNFISGLITVHNCDLTGYLLEQGNWELLTIPTEWDESQRYFTSIGWTDWRTKEKELMNPIRFPRNSVDELKIELGEYGFASQQQQKPVPLGGGLIKDSWWKTYWIPPSYFDSTVISMDLNNKEGVNNDNTALIVMGRKNADIYILDLVYENMDIVKQLQEIKKICEKHNYIRQKIIEDKGNGSPVWSLLKKHIPGLVPVDPKGIDKEVRIMATIPYINAGNIYIPDKDICKWILPLLSESTMFPKGKHDDALDAFAYGIDYLMNNLSFTKVPEEIITESKEVMSRKEIRSQLIDSYYGEIINTDRMYIRNIFN